MNEARAPARRLVATWNGPAPASRRCDSTDDRFVDDAYVGRAAPDAALSWQPRRAGRYDVRVVDDHGRSDERALEVSLVQ